MKRLPLNRSPHSIHQLYLHMVFVTKNRAKILEPSHETAYKALFADICSRIGLKLVSNVDRAKTLCQLIEFGMEQDHVHLVLRYPPTITISQLAQYLKGISSHELPPGKLGVMRKEGKPLWNSSYFAKTVGHMSIAQTVEYTKQQGKTDRPMGYIDDKCFDGKAA